MVEECGICFAEYPVDELELHREVCVVRLVFRCNVCHWDYTNKEGLWIHMDLHEISDGSKELHCQEVKAKQKYRECELCKDGRAFVDSQYWEHIQEAHDGFFLRCSACGEMFRSEKLRDDHALRHCKARAQTVASVTDNRMENQSNESNEPSPDCRQSEEHDAKFTASASKKKKHAGKMGGTTHIAAANDPEDIGLKMEVSVEETVLMPSDGYERSTIDSPAIAEANGDNMLAGSNNDPHSDDDASCKKCSHCGKILPSAASLSGHIQCYHTPVPCDICGITCPSKSAANHHKNTKHKESKHKCPYCSKPFHRTSEFTVHISVCKDRKYACELCGKHFKTPKYVRTHKRDSCRAMKALKRNTTGANANTSNSEHTSSLSTDKIQLAGHAEPNLEPILCPICGMTFRNQERFRKHVAICEHSEKYPCEICGRNLGSLHLFRRHKRRNHPNEKNDLEMEIIADETSSAKIDSEQSSGQILGDSERILEPTARRLSSVYWCRICRISFPTYGKAHYHKTRMHTKAKYECPHCSKKFHETFPLNVHLAACVDRKVSCKLCGKKLKRQRNLKLHMRRYHSVNETSNPEGMGYSEKQSSRNDEKICDVCGITFASVALKDDHMALTHDERIHQCPNCLKSFEISKYRIHLASCDVCNFPCGLCEFKFKRLVNLVRHTKKVHPGKKVSIKAPSFVDDGNEQPEQLNEESALPEEIPEQRTKEYELIRPQPPATKHSYAELSENENSIIEVQNELQDDDIELKMDIEVEDTMLQESQLSNDDRDKSSTIAETSQHDKTRNVQGDETLENEIQMKEERTDIKEEILTASQSTSESHGMPSDRNESDQFGPCSICGLSFATKSHMDDHMVVTHAEPEPRYKCSQCPKAFHSVDTHRRHEMMHKRLLS